MSKLLTAVLIVFCFTQAFSVVKAKTFIKGKKMEIIAGGKVIKFDGGASVIRSSSTLFADQIVQDKEADLLTASGNVEIKTISEIGEKINAHSQSAKYNIKTENSELVGNRCDVIYTSSDSLTNAKLFAKSINLYKSSSSIVAFGNVELITSSGIAKANNVVFMQNEKLVVLTGEPRPNIIFNNGLSDRAEINSDKATIKLDKKQVIFNGNVDGVVNFND